MEPISAGELNEKLKKEKTVEVCGLSFQIRKAPLLLLADENDDLWSLARQGREVLSEKIKALIANPSLPRMKRVLLAGLVQPKLSLMPEEGAVIVDLVVTNYELSAGLFFEIVNFSFEV